MERDGFITLHADPHDSRKAVIFLTDDARAIEQPISRLRGDIDARALDGLSEADQVRLREMLATVIENLRGLSTGSNLTYGNCRWWVVGLVS